MGLTQEHREAIEEDILERSKWRKKDKGMIEGYQREDLVMVESAEETGKVLYKESVTNSTGDEKEEGDISVEGKYR